MTLLTCSVKKSKMKEDGEIFILLAASLDEIQLHCPYLNLTSTF